MFILFRHKIIINVKTKKILLQIFLRCDKLNLINWPLFHFLAVQIYIEEMMRHMKENSAK